MFRFSPHLLLLRVLRPIALLFVRKLYSRVVIKGAFIEVRSGIIIRRRIYVRRDAVKCVCIEQGPILRFLRRFSLSATFKGEGERVDSKILLLPIVTLCEAQMRTNEYFNGFLSQKGVYCFKGRRFLHEKRLYCRREDIGSVKLTQWPWCRCSLKIALHSRHKNAVKVCGLPIERGETLYKTLQKNE